jgi:hypothetical protein
MVTEEQFETATDKALYWTASFYVAPTALPTEVRQALRAGLAVHVDDPASIGSKQAAHRASSSLSEAIEPLFNDIADRERLGRVDDYLFAATDDNAASEIQIRSPDEIEWETEGVSFKATPGSLGPQTVRSRRFWFVHKNAAVSWHLSFRADYEHTPAHFYFMSMMQKVLAPKEFRPPHGAHMTEVKVHAPLNGHTGIDPLDKVTIAEDGMPEQPFWVVVARWFQLDAKVLFDRLSGSREWRRSELGASADLFGDLVRYEPFLEIPGLKMPRFRFMFFFQDAEFFRRLLPPTDPTTGRRIPRASMVLEGCYVPFLEQLESRYRPNGPGRRSVALDDDYWQWVKTRPDYAEFKDEDTELFYKMKESIPAWEEDHRPDCLAYLFLAGFNQNIIDFMNQDASEVLDSIDPIYPSNDNQETEGFFVRFGNARAMTTYVRSSRSLESGNDYIGTCPYAFLIHVLTLHNEFLARDYEQETDRLIKNVERDIQSKLHSDAAERFYEFRLGAYANHFKDKYENVFRYDTEADVFAALEKRRGTERKMAYLDGIIANLEKQTGDSEARISKREDRSITFAVAAVGAFGLFGVLLQIDTMLVGDASRPRFSDLGRRWEVRLVVLSLLGSAAALVPLLWVLSGDLRRRLRRRPRSSGRG